MTVLSIVGKVCDTTWRPIFKAFLYNCIWTLPSSQRPESESTSLPSLPLAFNTTQSDHTHFYVTLFRPQHVFRSNSTSPALLWFLRSAITWENVLRDPLPRSWAHLATSTLYPGPSHFSSLDPPSFYLAPHPPWPTLVSGYFGRQSTCAPGVQHKYLQNWI